MNYNRQHFFLQTWNVIINKNYRIKISFTGVTLLRLITFLSLEENWQNLYFVPSYYFGLINIPAVKTKIKLIYFSWLHRPLFTVYVWDQNVYLRTVYYIAGSLQLCLQLMPPAALLAHGPHVATLTLITIVYASCGSNLDCIYVKIIWNFLHDNFVFFSFLLKYLDHTNCLL